VPALFLSPANISEMRPFRFINCVYFLKKTSSYCVCRFTIFNGFVSHLPKSISISPVNIQYFPERDTLTIRKCFWFRSPTIHQGHLSPPPPGRPMQKPPRSPRPRSPSPTDTDGPRRLIDRVRSRSRSARTPPPLAPSPSHPCVFPHCLRSLP